MRIAREVGALHDWAECGTYVSVEYRERLDVVSADSATAATAATTAFTATKGVLTTTLALTITVTNTNRAPVLAPVGDQSVAEGSGLTLTLAATDPDHDALTFAALPTVVVATQKFVASSLMLSKKRRLRPSVCGVP